MIKFEKTPSHINIYFCCGCVKKKISLKKPYRKDLYKSLYEYDYVFDNLPVIDVSNEYQDAIWILWFQGEENVPEIVKNVLRVCVISIQINKLLF